MSQRESGYECKERDAYETPTWVTMALAPHLRALESVWEPACGGGKMVEALQHCGFHVFGSDIVTGVDLVKSGPRAGRDGIITNRPYAWAQAFALGRHRCVLGSGRRSTVVSPAKRISGLASGLG